MKKYKLQFYTPVDAVERVKSACFKAGGGKLGNYEECCFDSFGTGQFRALEGAKPALGEIGVRKYVKEVKTEMLVERKKVAEVIQALILHHPYEEVAYEIIEVMNLDELTKESYNENSF